MREVISGYLPLVGRITAACVAIWASLAEHARLFAVDLPGFGASERREDLLSPQAMGEFLARLIAEADLGTAHIVAPDVGTAAALFAVAAHPERFVSVIVGSGGAAVPIHLGQPLASWVLDPDLDKYRRMDSQVIVGAAVDTIAGGISDDIRADYLACYDGDRFAESMRYVRRYPQELPVLAGLLPQITVPGTSSGKRRRRGKPRPSWTRSRAAGHDGVLLTGRHRPTAIGHSQPQLPPGADAQLGEHLA